MAGVIVKALITPLLLVIGLAELVIRMSIFVAIGIGTMFIAYMLLDDSTS